MAEGQLVDFVDSDDSNHPYEPQPKVAEEIIDLPEVNLTTTQRPLCPDLPSGEDSAHKEVVKPYKGKGKGKRTKKPDERPLSPEESVTKKPTIINTNKIYMPEEEMKMMNIKIHPVLWKQKYMGEVGRQVEAAGARVVVDSTLCHPALVMWSRRLPQKFDSTVGAQIKLPTEEHCARAFYIVPAQEIGDLLTTHLLNIRELCDCDITVVVYRDPSAKDRRAVMTELEVGVATVGTLPDLLATAGCDSSIVNSPAELAALIVQFTKTLAEARFKKANSIDDKLAEFCMVADDSNVPIDDDGAASNISLQMWQQIPEVAPTSTPEISKTDPQLPNIIQNVENITISPTGEPDSIHLFRRDFSRKLYRLFTKKEDDEEDTLI